MDAELLLSLIEAISALNQKQSDLESNNKELSDDVSDLSKAQTKESKQIQAQIEALQKTLTSLIKDEIANIPKPKDGADYDVNVARTLMKAEINRLIKQRGLEVEKIKAEIVTAVEAIPVPSDGKDGRSVTEAQISIAVNSWINDNFESLKGDDGQDGTSGRDGLNGKQGEDGRGITDATMDKEYLVLTFSDGTEERVKMPKKTVYLGGGGGSSSSTEITDAYDVKYGDTNVGDALDAVDAGTIAVFQARTELEGMFNSAYATAYSELTYTNGDITQITVYENDTKALLLFTKDILSVDGNIIGVIITNETNTQTLTKEIAYDINGNIESTKVY